MRVYLSKKVKSGLYIGIDAAAKTGWAVVRVCQNNIELIDFGSIALERNMPELKKFQVFESTLSFQISKYFRYSNVTVVIEDCFLGKWNPKTFKLLARLEGYIIHWIKTQKKDADIVLIPAVTARKVLGAKKIRGSQKKRILANFVNALLKQQYFTEKHHDICDAIMLALAVAVIKGGGYEQKSRKNNSRTQ